MPASANEAIYTNLAIRLAPGYGKIVSPDTKLIAKSSYDVLLLNSTSPREMQLPGTMPAGAGNKPWRLTSDEFITNPVDHLDKDLEWLTIKT